MAASYQLQTLSKPFSQLSIENRNPVLLNPVVEVIAAHPRLNDRKLRVAVIGGGPAGSSAAEALASGGIDVSL
ncbi:hypothetical protein F3Y22_tig00110882pilonHSYRG00145 [Hibiscus syriacus]|uniref:Uncharacterized protein n=1 Tax=Hibiscus syriacus TaxID=106335 RepID=A0A6A2ZJC4_HIBSY|nr:hypothetical protein F3Y22_tig00110882pilonHSYRG00145 [Hibiscus syriacus]